MSEKPVSQFVRPLLTDMYQVTMAYSYFKMGMHETFSSFDLFFRKNPFKGEFTLFCGLSECMKLVQNFYFSKEEAEYVRSILPGVTDDFIEYIQKLPIDKVKIYAIEEGTVVFPRVPLLCVEGPLCVCQLLETPLLNCVNYASLMATNAARMRLRAGTGKKLLEFGLRRAQGPDGGMSASRYAFEGGFDATSNLLAGMTFGIDVRGTHAHSYVSSFTGLEDVKVHSIKNLKTGKNEDFFDAILVKRKKLGLMNTNTSELAAFVAYAITYPTGFLALVDTYDTLTSGVPNYIVVALTLCDFGYKPVGIRLDSGDLAFLSKESRTLFRRYGEENNNEILKDSTIVASNDINEKTLVSLAAQGHEINVFGIGTHLVTCQAQPALGCVYKLVQVGDKPRVKISQEVVKITIPGKKRAFRVFSKEGKPLVDVLTSIDEDIPAVGKRIMCRHPFDEAKRAYVIPSKVQELHKLVWDGKVKIKLPSSTEVRDRTIRNISSLREDHVRFLNPTPYKVAVSNQLYDFIHSLWMEEAPIAELT